MNEICNESTTLVPLELGFIHKTDPWMLTSHSFPSKAGGRPAWLSLGSIPRGLTCNECNKPLYFLLQVYAPIEGNSECFHRSILLFICGNGACYQEGKQPTMRAFRSQLPRDNPYYFQDTVNITTIECINNRGNLKQIGIFSNVCAVCGSYGNLQCGKCAKVVHCCKEHRLFDLEMRHEVECSEIMTGSKCWSPIMNWDHNKYIFPEYELVMGPDPHCDDEFESADNHTTWNNAGEEKSHLERDMEDTEGKTEPMSVDCAHQHQHSIENANKFEERYHNSILREPNQVLRYHRGGEPLWISAKHRMEHPPVCSRCGTPRQFEFQVLPQLLNHMNLELHGNSIDWGSLFVFTCSKSCDIGAVRDHNDGKEHESDYVEEFVWKQDSC